MMVLAFMIVLVDRSRIREGQANWTTLTLGTLVNMGSCLSPRLVLAPKAEDLNAIADSVSIRNDTVLEDTIGTLKSAGKFRFVTGTFDDLVGGCLDAVARRKDLCCTLPLAVTLAIVVNLLPVNGVVVDLAILEEGNMLVCLHFE